MDNRSPLSQLSPQRHQALYDLARQRATQLRSEAIGDLIDALVAVVRRPWQVTSHASIGAAGHVAAAPCPR